MPSFFETLKRLIMGEPVFTAEDQAKKKPGLDIQVPAGQPLPQQQASQQRPMRTGPKVIPQLYIEEVDCRENGMQMQVMANIKNASQQTLELDKVKIFNSSYELDSFLRPGEERQYRLYSGNRPQNTYNGNVEIYFKDEFGDYFSAVHLIEFEKMQDGTYTIRRLRFTPPIRDI